MPSATYSVLRSAVVARSRVSATYKSQLRFFCPHLIGTKDGEEHVLAYMFGGGSVSRPVEPVGSEANWRCFVVSELMNVRLINGAWCTADDYSVADQSCVDVVDKAV